MDINDPLKLVTPERVTHLMNLVRQPEPADIRLISQPKRQAHYQVQFMADANI
ncbi:MAG: hypothetical protein HN348_25755, partial [Proteobacteria bacterium]|nr:hypothetical protein [Pseudomonadota bacterium]